MQNLDDMQPALEGLESERTRLMNLLGGVNSSINTLYRLCGEAEPYEEVAAEDKSRFKIRPGQFFQQPLATAIKHYLIAKSKALGPKTPASIEDIYASLKEGSFEFESRSESKRMANLKISMAKNAAFKSLPDGYFGLSIWYRSERSKPKSQSEDSNGGGNENQDDTEDLMS